jgi:hypothetical protein
MTVRRSYNRSCYVCYLLSQPSSRMSPHKAPCLVLPMRMTRPHYLPPLQSFLLIKIHSSYLSVLSHHPHGLRHRRPTLTTARSHHCCRSRGLPMSLHPYVLPLTRWYRTTRTPRLWSKSGPSQPSTSSVGSIASE